MIYPKFKKFFYLFKSEIYSVHVEFLFRVFLVGTVVALDKLLHLSWIFFTCEIILPVQLKNKLLKIESKL